VEPERWQTLERIYHAVLDSDSSQRSSVLDRACGGDESLRHEVESLLEYGQRAGSALEKPGFELVARALAAEQSRDPKENAGHDRLIGSRIANYQVVARLGSGGMGDVYLAVRADDSYRKQVALKLVRQGLDTDSVYRRFHNERQILAGLEHENIARLLDGGATEEGVPYFVMELVEGQPIDVYCDERRLSLRARIQLFQTICAAVQYAHQRLVVHRDIKPRNVLVTADGVPKLLDFGIATILNPDAGAADPTVTAARMLTPAFASPEQLRGERITTATDIYSLGVLLYKLLTGRMPYGDDSAYDLVHAICHQEPTRPSATMRADGAASRLEEISRSRSTTPDKLKRTLSGDLDQILLKALRKEPGQRYRSVESFSDDLRLYSAGMPVSARRGTLTYRANKFIRRNRLSLAAASAVALMTIAGVAAIVREARIARAESARAERQFDSLRKLTNSMLFEFHDSIENLPGSTSARQMVVRRALEYLNEMDRDAHGNPAVQRDLAAAYERIARIQGEQYRAHLGGAGAAEQSRQLLERALAIRRNLAAGNPGDLNLQFDLLDTIVNVATIYYVAGDLDRALQLQQLGLQIEERLAVSHHSEELQYRTASTLIGIGVLKYGFGDYERALDYERRSLKIKETLLTANPASFRAQRQVLISHYWLGDTLKREKKYAEAAGEYRESVAEADRLLANDPNNTDLQRLEEGAEDQLCTILAYAGKLSEVASHCRKAISMSEGMVGADKKNVQAAADLASANLSAATAYYQMRLQRQALPYGQRADRIYKEVETLDPDSVSNSIDHGETLLLVGRIEARLGQPSSARKDMERARELIRRTVERSPKNRYYKDSLDEVEAAIQVLPR